MADKEIIIHEVNVNKCWSYIPWKLYSCGGTDKCIERPNCNFKQIARYRKALEEIEGYVKTTIRMPLERKVIINIIGKAKGEAND